jgi:hypothetical protein
VKRFLVSLALVALVASSAFAVKSVNSRNIPEKEDYSTFGASYQNLANMYDTLLDELANILSANKASDCISVQKATADSVVVSKIANITGKVSVDTIDGLAVLAGNPTADSIVVSVIANVTGKVSVDTIDGLGILKGNPMIDSIVIGANNPSITDVDTGTNNDTLVIKLGGVSYKIAVTH